MIAIGLERIKSVPNFGSVLRAAECFNAQLVILHNERLDSFRAATDTYDTVNRCPVVRVSGETILDATPITCTPVVIERVEGATSLVNFEHPKNAFYIFGPEDGEVLADTQSRVSRIVTIPVSASLNLAAAVTIVLYDRLLKDSERVKQRVDGIASLMKVGALPVGVRNALLNSVQEED